MWNDNEAKRIVIISRLPNRSAPKKTTASATGKKSIPSSVPPVVKLKSSMTVSEAERPRSSWQPWWWSGGGVIHTSAAPYQSLPRTHTKKTGSAPSRSENLSREGETKHRQSIILQQCYLQQTNVFESLKNLTKKKTKLRRLAKIEAGYFPS